MSSVSAILVNLRSESDSKSESELETLCYAVILERKEERGYYIERNTRRISSKDQMMTNFRTIVD